ncbi:DMT family transporter [Shimia litoralis]|uniref:DMT family transporter n=1 Tax=Shimia litoralis TaxID=420403 RepID=A0A4U7N7M4_9RHOB|nr:DMT family transporter [Shimia litoralis]TKZ21919.1 DMT family transporter [Shimia litoralis]
MGTSDHKPALAALLTVCASAFVAGTTLLAKALGTGVLGTPLHALQISQGRFMFAFLIFACVAVLRRPTITRPALGLHVGRSALGWGGVTLMFASAAFIPLSDATAISFLNPVIGMMLAIPFLGERVGPWRIFSAGLALLGAIILMRPGAGAIQAGALLAVCAAIMMGSELIFIKLLSRREKPFQILLINNTIGVILASVAAYFVWQTATPVQWIALAAIGALMAAAQTCFVNAMRFADASFVSPFFYTTLAFATLYDVILFNVIPDAISWAGAALILISAAILAWRETRR